MNWLTATVIAIGVLFWCVRKGATTQPAKTEPPRPKPKRVDIDTVLESGDLSAIDAALAGTDDALARHRLLTAAVTALYPQRKDSEARKKMYAYGATYLTEFSGIADAMARQSDAPERMAPVFKCLAIALEEDQRYDKALEICDIALARGLDDGTKTGYAGRKSRLERKQAVGN